MTYTELFTQLVRAEIELWDSLDRHLHASVQLSLPTVQALAAVDSITGPGRVQDVSDAMSITVGATSKLVDRLERAGFVTRESNPDDRRSSYVVLTAQGRASLKAGEAAVEAHVQRVLAGIYSPDQAVSLSTELAALRSHLTNGVAA